MSTPLTIELFSASSCSRCSKAKKQIRQLLDEFNTETIAYSELNVLEELDYAVSLGILTTPSIAMDGKLIFSTLPSMKKLRHKIQQHLENK
ncbi:MAG TPA: glutaredoxin [Aeromonadales bacterium]|nr:glutaredoxin [Aeromonadales bacterium]